MPISLVTEEDMRSITSRNLEEIAPFPRLYIPLSSFIPTETDPDAMKHWGIAYEKTPADYAQDYPDALIAPHDFGDRASRADLLYHGAEPIGDFVSAS